MFWMRWENQFAKVKVNDFTILFLKIRPYLEKIEDPPQLQTDFIISSKKSVCRTFIALPRQTLKFCQTFKMNLQKKTFLSPCYPKTAFVKTICDVIDKFQFLSFDPAQKLFSSTNCSTRTMVAKILYLLQKTQNLLIRIG